MSAQNFKNIYKLENVLCIVRNLLRENDVSSFLFM